MPITLETENSAVTEINSLLNLKGYKYTFQNTDNSDFDLKIAPLCTNSKVLDISINAPLEYAQEIQSYILGKLQWKDLVYLEVILREKFNESYQTSQEMQDLWKRIDSFLGEIANK